MTDSLKIQAPGKIFRIAHGHAATFINFAFRSCKNHDHRKFLKECQYNIKVETLKACTTEAWSVSSSDSEIENEFRFAIESIIERTESLNGWLL